MNDTLKGAIIALMGVGAGQVVAICTNWLQREERRNAVLREKCEQMGDLLTSGSQWFNKLTLCYSFEDLKRCPPPAEYTKVAIFAKLYFPRLEELAVDYCNLVIQYYHYQLDCVPPQEGQLPISGVARAVGINKAKYKEWDSRITEAKTKLLDALCTQVKEHL